MNSDLSRVAMIEMSHFGTPGIQKGEKDMTPHST